MKFKEEEFQTLNILEDNPLVTQREVAKKLGFSLGKTHYVLKALINKGFIKVTNFTKSNNKMGYIYQLTPEGILEKTALTKNFLKIKIDEYENLKKEIINLQKKSDINE